MVDRYIGNMLQGFSQVGVGEVINVFCVDCIYYVSRIMFDVYGFGNRRVDIGYSNGFNFLLGGVLGQYQW